MAPAARMGLALAALAVGCVTAGSLWSQALLEHARDTVRSAPPGPLDPGLRDAALDDLRRAARLRPGTEAGVLAAQVQLRSGRYEETVRAAREVVREEPDSFAGWVLLSAGLARTGHPDGAREALGRAKRLNPLYQPRR